MPGALKACPAPGSNNVQWPLAMATLNPWSRSASPLKLSILNQGSFFNTENTISTPQSFTFLNFIWKHHSTETCFWSLFVLLKKESACEKNYICSLNTLSHFNFRKGSFLAVPYRSIWNALTLRQMLRIKQLNRHQLFFQIIAKLRFSLLHTLHS